MKVSTLLTHALLLVVGVVPAVVNAQALVDPPSPITTRQVANPEGTGLRQTAPTPSRRAPVAPTQQPRRVQTQRQMAAQPVGPKVATTNPMLTVETKAPAQINVNQTAAYSMLIRNNSRIDAYSVELTTVLPANMEIRDSSIDYREDANGTLRFSVGHLPANKAAEVHMQLVPRAKGDVSVDCYVTFTTGTRLPISVREPKLKLACQMSKEAIFGSNIPIRVVVTNEGDGIAHDVEVAPVGDSAEIKPVRVGTLQPGQSRNVAFTLSADVAGRQSLRFRAEEASGGKTAVDSSVVIRQPKLETEVFGPERTFANRENGYELRIRNTGDALLQDVDVACQFSSGLHVHVVSSPVKFDRQRNLLTTRIEQLPPGATHLIRLKVKAAKGGVQTAELVARNAKLGISSDAIRQTQVMTRSNINVAVVDRNEATEVDEAAQMDVVLVNGGTKDAENVNVRVQIPASLRVTPTEQYAVQGQELVFAPISIGAGQKKVLTFQVTCDDPGDHHVRVVVSAIEESRPLSADGSVFFFTTRRSELAEKPQLERTESTRRPGPFGAPR